MVASIILGCGLPTAAVYIILASLAAQRDPNGSPPWQRTVCILLAVFQRHPHQLPLLLMRLQVGDANPSKQGKRSFGIAIHRALYVCFSQLCP